MSNVKTVPAPPGFVAVFAELFGSTVVFREEPVLFILVQESQIEDEVQIWPVLFDTNTGFVLFDHENSSNFVCFRLPGHWKEVSSADLDPVLVEAVRKRLIPAPVEEDDASAGTAHTQPLP